MNTSQEIPVSFTAVFLYFFLRVMAFVAIFLLLILIYASSSTDGMTLKLANFIFVPIGFAPFIAILAYMSQDDFEIVLKEKEIVGPSIVKSGSDEGGKTIGRRALSKKDIDLVMSIQSLNDSFFPRVYSKNGVKIIVPRECFSQ